MTEDSLTWLVAVPFHPVCSFVLGCSLLQSSAVVGMEERFWKWPRSPTLLSTYFPYLYWFVPPISLPLGDKLLCGRDRGSDTALHSGAAADPWRRPGITQHQTVCTHYLIWCRQSLSWALAFPPVLLKVSLRLRRIRWLSYISSHHRGKTVACLFFILFLLLVYVWVHVISIPPPNHVLS